DGIVFRLWAAAKRHNGGESFIWRCGWFHFLYLQRVLRAIDSGVWHTADIWCLSPELSVFGDCGGVAEKKAIIKEKGRRYAFLFCF
ncbi:putative permease YjgP/YjgQ family protein, partial [Vibrio parahaemolyticus V-223/04]